MKMMMRMRAKSITATVAAAVCFASSVQAQTKPAERVRLMKVAQRVTITRDDWGIAHVHGRTDADAIFGMIYAQAEDDFNRIEVNYLNSLGRLAEAEGEAAIWSDLRQRLFINNDSLKRQYAISPAWLKAIMNGWADGLNYYLARNPRTKPRVITHFEPWMALSFSEGSIGGDIERVNLGPLQAFYTRPGIVTNDNEPAPYDSYDPYNDKRDYYEEGLGVQRPTGSNGMAVAPKNTVNKRSLLLINPHTTFFFRSELQVTSDEGLNAYGAATWGQLFLYQGFNSRVGWMHPSSGVDNVDEFLETVSTKGQGAITYRHGASELPMKSSVVAIRYKTPTGMATRTFTTYRTMHGPVIRSVGDKWVSIALMESPSKALEQSFIRTKAKNYAEFSKSLENFTNSSNNTVYADADGNIAYFHSNYIPRRDTKFDWTKPVDGSDPATDYKGLLTVNETPKLFNPASGWLYNSNDVPWEAAGPSSQKKEDFPVYVEAGTGSARGRHAVLVLQNKHDFTIEGLRAAAYDSYQPWFEKPIPALVAAWDAATSDNPLKAKTAEQIAMLRSWDLRWGASSVPTSLAIYWAENAQRLPGMSTGTASATDMLQALSEASGKLTADFGTWKTPWGDINRFQRITDDMVHPFTDAGPSIPVGFTTANWGSLASFNARRGGGGKKRYGYSGNSFVAVVELGADSVRARAVTAGGESGNPASKHFNDQAGRYATGNLREVYFYPSQLKGHTERVYHPGDK